MFVIVCYYDVRLVLICIMFILQNKILYAKKEEKNICILYIYIIIYIYIYIYIPRLNYRGIFFSNALKVDHRGNI